MSKSQNTYDTESDALSYEAESHLEATGASCQMLMTISLIQFYVCPQLTTTNQDIYFIGWCPPVRQIVGRIGSIVDCWPSSKHIQAEFVVYFRS